jgi:phosphoglycerate dehydrogenase-like enzyme
MRSPLCFRSCADCTASIARPGSGNGTSQAADRFAGSPGRSSGSWGWAGSAGASPSARARSGWKSSARTGRPARSRSLRSGCEPASLRELLAEADVVSLHAPSDPHAAPLLGAEQLALMRRQALLVNTARAALVDLDALADRLNRGRLAGAHFDVWATEPPDWDDPRLRARNLFLSPHAAWVSPEAEAALWREAARAITAVLAGHDPPHRLA